MAKSQKMARTSKAARPELMVIGDSIGQGVRSLSIKEEYARTSYPAWIARSQGWPFVHPDFPIPILFDVEEEIRHLFTTVLDIQSLCDRINANFAYWVSDAEKSSHKSFDNLAVGAQLLGTS